MNPLGDAFGNFAFFIPVIPVISQPTNSTPKVQLVHKPASKA